jgi:hypothetical protein
MQPDQAADYVAGILTRNEVPFATREDGRGHRVLYGTTAVFITVAPFGDEDAIVSLSAPALEQLDPDSAPKILSRINQLNCENYFGKWCLYDDVIRVEHELLASRLQPEEMMNALRMLAEQADSNDDALQQELGGKTWQQVDTETHSEQEALET